MKRTILIILLVSLAFSGCGKVKKEAEIIRTVNHLSQEEALKIMSSNENYLIVDVRTPSEYAEGHIPGAVNVPNEEIKDKMPEGLPDKDQILLLYCRTGIRSREAAGKLAGIGYTKVNEFGGINSWTGEIEK